MNQLENSAYLLPKAVDLEEAIICAMMVDSTAMSIIAPILSSEDFDIKINQDIFSAALNLFVNSLPIDLFTLSEEIDRLKFPIGLSELMRMANKVGSIANLEYHCFLVKEKSIHRKIIMTCTTAMSQSFNNEKNSTEVIAELTANLLDASNLFQKKETLSEVYNRVLNENESFGYKTGFDKLDNHTNGIDGFVIIAAGTGEGKSILALNIARKVSETYKVLFFSLEMKKNEIVRRLMSDEQNVQVVDIIKKRFDMDKSIKSKIPDLKLEIYDDGCTYVDDLYSIAKSKFKKNEKGLIIVDYLQLLQPSKTKRFGTRENEVSYITRRLKQLNMELNIPVIALSQVSRASKYRGGFNGYVLSDLRESGSIEQDANGVIFIFRPKKHDIDKIDTGDGEKQVTDSTTIIKIAKWRNGALADFELSFNGKYSRFENHNEAIELSKPIDSYDHRVNIRNDGFDVPF